MAYDNPSVADFKAYYSRDFPFGTDPNTSVTDGDITKSFMQTNAGINQGLFCDQPAYSIGYNLLSAHYLVSNLNASSSGLNGGFSWLEQSKAVGSVSQSFAIPQYILDNPYMAMLSKTSYGAQYLFMILPELAGQMFIAPGRTLP